MSEDHNIFTERGITPPWERGGDVAREQGFARYEGEDWRERREALASLPGASLFGADAPPERDRARAELDDLVAEDRAWYLTGREFGGRIPALASLGTLTARERRELERMREAAQYTVEKMPRTAAQRAAWWPTWLGRVLDCDGWAMPRFDALGGRALDTQIRPDRPVPEWRTYSPVRTDDDDAGRRAWRAHVRLHERTEHALSVCDIAPADHPERIEHEDGAFLPTGHLHPLTGLVCWPLNGNLRTPHYHWSEAKYMFAPGDGARGLGTHPRCQRENFGDGLFVVVLEGTLKMCSVVEAGYPAIDAGSVTLWRSLASEYEGSRRVILTELELFAREHLQGRPVAVVCDSDWSGNIRVREQTDDVTAILRANGANAVACAPTDDDALLEELGWRHPATGEPFRGSLGWTHPTRGPARKKLGVDDLLGGFPPHRRHDALLNGLVTDEPTGDVAPGLHEALARVGGDGRRAESMRATFEALGRAGGSRGIFARRREELAHDAGISETTLWRRLGEATEAGDIEKLTESLFDPRLGLELAGLSRLATELRWPHRSESLREWLGREAARNPCA